MANNVENAVNQLREFLKSDKENVVLIKGTPQYKKHRLVLALMEQIEGFKRGLFRINGLDNTALFLDQAGYKVSLTKRFASGKPYSFHGFDLYFDSLFKQNTWINTPHKLDFALVYPMMPSVSRKLKRKRNSLTTFFMIET